MQADVKCWKSRDSANARTELWKIILLNHRVKEVMADSRHLWLSRWFISKFLHSGACPPLKLVHRNPSAPDNCCSGLHVKLTIWMSGRGVIGAAAIAVPEPIDITEGKADRNARQPLHPARVGVADFVIRYAGFGTGWSYRAGNSLKHEPGFARILGSVTSQVCNE